jgi:hypothetical protein
LAYFAELSRILKNDMAPIINQVLDEILARCNSGEGVKNEIEKTERDAFSLDTDSEDEGAIIGIWTWMSTSFMTNLLPATRLEIFPSSALLLPRMEEILDVLNGIAFYFHENIRYHVCLTYLPVNRNWTDEAFPKH